MADTENMTKAELLIAIKYTKSKLAKLDDPSEDHTKMKKELDGLQQKFIEASLNSDDSSTGPGKPGKDYEWFQMRNAIATSISTIPKFNGGGAVELCAFLENLSQAHDTFCKDAKFEEPFMQSATMRLSQHVYSNLKSSGKDVSTFEKLKDWLKSTYDAQLTPYQLLGCAWDTSFDQEQKFVLYAQSVEKSMRTATKFIFEEHKKKTNEDMTADQFSMLVAGMLLVEKLNHKCPEIYRGLIPKIKDLTTATEVATHAETLRAQYGTTSQLTTESESAFAERYRNQSRYGNNDRRAKSVSFKDRHRSTSPKSDRNDSGEQKVTITPSQIQKFMQGELRLPDRFYTKKQLDNRKKKIDGKEKRKADKGFKKESAHAQNPNPPKKDDNGTASIPSIEDYLKADFPQ